MDIIISNSLDKPIYMQIKEQVIDQIINEELKPGEMLPSIRVLAKELRISVITTKRAYEELEKDGLIYTIPGKGSFVAGFDEGRLRESKEQLVEEKLKEALSTAELLGVGRAELRRIIERLLEDGK